MRVVRRFLRVLLLIVVALLLAAAGGYFLDRTSVSTGISAELRPGYMVWRSGHVGIYMGGGEVIHPCSGNLWGGEGESAVGLECGRRTPSVEAMAT